MGVGEEIVNQVKQRGKDFIKQGMKKVAGILLKNPYFYIVIGIFLIIIVISGAMADGSVASASNTEGYTSVGESDFSGQGLVDIATGLHDYIRENQYAYSCSHNVSNGYRNTCTCSGTSHFGKNNFEEFDEIKCIDCSAYVSWVLNQYLGNDEFSSRWWSGNFGDESKWPGDWEKIDMEDIQAGDILWKQGHVGIYIGDGKTVEAGSTNAIRAEYSYGSIQSVVSAYTFGIRIP